LDAHCLVELYRIIAPKIRKWVLQVVKIKL
jgi:hypothetical protein